MSHTQAAAIPGSSSTVGRMPILRGQVKGGGDRALEIFTFAEQRRDGSGPRGYQLAGMGERHERCGSRGFSTGVTAA
jgi:hypothetical protein